MHWNKSGMRFEIIAARTSSLRNRHPPCWTQRHCAHRISYQPGQQRTILKEPLSDFLPCSDHFRTQIFSAAALQPWIRIATTIHISNGKKTRRSSPSRYHLNTPHLSPFSGKVQTRLPHLGKQHIHCQYLTTRTHLPLPILRYTPMPLP